MNIITDLEEHKHKMMEGYRKRMKKREHSKKDDNSHCSHKGCWCHAKIELPKLSYLERKRRAGLIDPSDIEPVENVDTTYEELMALKWDYIVVGAARSWGNQTMLDELLSAGREGLLMAIRTWNQSKGMQSTYFSRCVKNAMINVMRKEETYRKYTPFTLHDAVRDRGAVEYHYFQQDDLNWEDIKASDVPNPEELLIRREDVEEAKTILANVIGALNERESYVLTHRILERDMSLQEIADKFGVSHMAIKRDEERIINILNKLRKDI